MILNSIHSLRLFVLLGLLFVDGLWLSLLQRTHASYREKIVAESVHVLIRMWLNLFLLKQRNQVPLGSSANSTSNVEIRSCQTSRWKNKILERRQYEIHLVYPFL